MTIDHAERVFEEYKDPKFSCPTYFLAKCRLRAKMDLLG